MEDEPREYDRDHSGAYRRTAVPGPGGETPGSSPSSGATSASSSVPPSWPRQASAESSSIPSNARHGWVRPRRRRVRAEPGRAIVRSGKRFFGSKRFPERISAPVQYVRMSNTDTGGGDEPTKAAVNIRLTESFLGDIDATWHEEGYNSRSEFIRSALRDAVKHPGLTRESWKEIAAVEHACRTGESETFARNEILGDE